MHLGDKNSIAVWLCKESYAHLIRVPDEEPLLSGLDLQGHYNGVAGVDHRSVVPSPQRLQESKVGMGGLQILQGCPRS